MEKFVYIIIDSETGESDSFEGVFDTSELAIQAAKETEMILFTREVFKVKLNKVGNIYWEKPIFIMENKKS